MKSFLQMKMLIICMLMVCLFFSVNVYIGYTASLEQSEGTYSVFFDANGGTALYGNFETLTAKKGTPITIPRMPAQKDNCIFLGWSTDRNAKVVSYEPSDFGTEVKAIFEKDTTLYAVWKDLYQYNTEMTLQNRIFTKAFNHFFLITPERTVKAYRAWGGVQHSPIGNEYDCEFCNIVNNVDFRNIIMLEPDFIGHNLYGLRADGTVVVTNAVRTGLTEIIDPNRYGQQNIWDWTNVISISASDGHILGLRSDGTVYAAGNNEYGQCNTGEWSDIVQIDAANDLSVGLKSDGSVVYAGRDYVVTSWTNDENGDLIPAIIEENLFSRFSKDSEYDIDNVVKIAAVNGINANEDSLAIVYLQGDGTLSAAANRGAYTSLNEILGGNVTWFGTYKNGIDSNIICLEKDGGIRGAGTAINHLSLYSLKDSSFFNDCKNFNAGQDTFACLLNNGNLLTTCIGLSNTARPEEWCIMPEIRTDNLYEFKAEDTENIAYFVAERRNVLYITKTGVLRQLTMNEQNTTLPEYIGNYPPNIILNGNAIFGDINPIIIEGRTLVPLRMIFEKLGASVEWNENTQTVNSKKGNITVIMKIGNNVFYKNGIPIKLDVAPQIVGERTLVPVRAIAEAFDCSVDWDSETQTVTITN